MFAKIHFVYYRSDILKALTMKNICKIGLFLLTVIAIFMVREYMFSPTLSAEVSALTKVLTRKNQIEWNVFDPKDMTSSGYQLLHKINAVASDEEILQLTESLEPHVRVYGVILASQREAIDKRMLLLSHLKDAAEVEVRASGKSSRMKVGDFYIHFLYPCMSGKHQSSIDSMILYDKTNKLACIKDVMNRSSENGKHYLRIREIYCKEYQKDALVYLAKFQQEQDIPYILNDLKCFYSSDVNRALNAVIVFPNPVFLPVLIEMYSLLLQNKLHDSVDISLLFKALVNYELLKVYALLKNSIINSDEVFVKNNLPLLKQVISESNSSFYKPLYNLIP